MASAAKADMVIVCKTPLAFLKTLGPGAQTPRVCIKTTTTPAEALVLPARAARALLPVVRAQFPKAEALYADKFLERKDDWMPARATATQRTVVDMMVRKGWHMHDMEMRDRDLCVTATRRYHDGDSASIRYKIGPGGAIHRLNVLTAS